MNTILPSGAAPPSWSSALVNWSSHATAPTPTGFPGASTAVQQRQSGGAGAALCFAPFIATEDTRHQVSFLPGCGLSCHDSVWYEEDEYDRLSRTIIALATISLLLTAFTLISSLVDPRSRQFPAVLLLNINICLCASSIGWIWTYSEGDDIICYEDGTLRFDAPSEVGDFKCVLSFMFIFYFTMAAHVWFVLLAISWNFAFLHLGKPKMPSASDTRKLLLAHHIIAWTLPALLTGAALGTMQLDGLWLGRICHLSLIRENNYARIMLLLIPEGVTILLGAIFLTRGVLYLESLRRQQTNGSFLSGQSNKLIKETIVKIGLFSFLLLLFHLLNIAVHVTESVSKDSWIESFHLFVSCRGAEIARAAISGDANLPALVSGVETSCTVEHKPHLGVIFIGFIAQVAIGIAMGTWGVNRHSLSKWKQLFMRVYKMMTTYHGNLDLEKERVAADRASDAGDRRMSNRSNPRPSPDEQPEEDELHELEMYANPLVTMGAVVHVAPPSPVSPVNLHANPISFHGNRVSVTRTATLKKRDASSTTATAAYVGDCEPGLATTTVGLEPVAGQYGTWPTSPSKKTMYGANATAATATSASWKPTPPKRNKSKQTSGNNTTVQLLSHTRAEDYADISTATGNQELNQIIPREQMSLPRSIVGTGRYVLQAANFGSGEMTTAESALYHGRPLSEKDKKRAVVVIEMSDDGHTDA
eukprot:scpid34867/ scgid2031/ Smoothened homolog